MRILGIDPGTINAGFGIIDFNSKRNKMSYIIHGAISPNKKNSKVYRLGEIFKDLIEIINEFKPQILSIEKAFYSKNINVAISLGEARGVAIAAASIGDLKIYEYAPREIKQSVVGRGNASKEQVGFMVKSILGIRDDNSSFDATDALAIAMCHANNIFIKGHIK